MAKLGPYYSLCPLIHAKSLLGVTEDSEDGVVIVTLGQNISSKYKVSDQKQVHCWRTKDKFTSPVIYDKNSSKYVAVFNQSSIKLWNEGDNLDKVKRYRINAQIYTLIYNGENTFVIFCNGFIYKLEDVLEQRKTLSLEDGTNINIKHVLHKVVNNGFYVGLIIETSDGHELLLNIHNNGNFDVFKIKISKEGHTLVGSVLHFDNRMNLMTLWSDGSLSSYPLENCNTDTNGVGALFSVIDTVCTKHSISLLSLNQNYLAMYGANTEDEGAVIIFYNTQFKITEAKQTFKLFTDGLQLWAIKNSLMLPVGQNLAVIPFRLELNQLAALVGSHISQYNADEDLKIVSEIQVALWNSKFKISKRTIPKELLPKISEFVHQGLPESFIIESILPEVLKNRNIKLLGLILQYFSDVPEKCLVKILKFLLTCDEQYFDESKCNFTGLPNALQPSERITLLDQVLTKPFSDIFLIPHLRSEFTLNNVILLLNYLQLLCSNDGYVLPKMNFVQTESISIEWCCALIDSSYQKFVLSNEESIKAILTNINTLISDHLKCIESLKDVIPILEQVKSKKPLNKNIIGNHLRYGIEQIKLY